MVYRVGNNEYSSVKAYWRLFSEFLAHETRAILVREERRLHRKGAGRIFRELTGDEVLGILSEWFASHGQGRAEYLELKRLAAKAERDPEFARDPEFVRAHPDIKREFAEAEARFLAIKKMHEEATRWKTPGPKGKAAAPHSGRKAVSGVPRRRPGK